jgi:hypothetical protein
MTAANNTSNLSTDPAVGTVIATIDRAARAFAATTHVQPLLTAIPCLTAQHIELSTDIQPAYSVWLAWEATNIVLSMRHNIFTMRVGDDYRSDLAVNIENSKFVSRADTRLSLTMEDIISRLKLPSGMPLFPDNQLFNSTVGDGTNNPTDMELIIIASILIVNSPFLSGRNHGKGIPVPEPYASLILTPNP